MNRARSVPSPGEDEKSDEKIKQRGDAKVIFYRRRILLWRGDQRHAERFPGALEAILNFSPRTRAPHEAGYVGGMVNCHAANGLYDVAWLDSGAIPGRTGSHARRHYAL